MKIQIAKIVFLTHLAIVKKILDLLEFKLGKNTDEYKYLKKQIFDYFYEGIKKMFKSMSDAEILQKCDCDSKIRNGYSPCDLCGGCGYKNKDL